MTKDEILSELEKRGYEIIIEENENNYSVTFNGEFTLKPYKLLKTYSKEYTKREIKLDCVLDLMKWAGYYVKEILEIKGF